MFHGALNRTGGTMTTPVTNSGAFWNYTTGNYIYASPIVSGGRVFVGGTDNRLHCVNATTGAKIWDYITFSQTYNPAIAGDLVYVGSGSVLRCVNETTKVSVWNFTTSYGVGSSPAIWKGRVFAGNHDHNMYCLNATNGSVLWSFTTGHTISSAPAVVGGRVFFGSVDNKTYCLDAMTGAHVWNYTTGDHIYSSPSVANGRVYIGSDDGLVYCLNASTGTCDWSYYTTGRIDSCPAVVGNRVYVASQGWRVLCLDALNGSLIWTYATTAYVSSSPAVANGLVYFSCSLQRKFFCVNATTGALCWAYKTNVSDASPAIAGGRVFLPINRTNLCSLPMIALPIAPKVTVSTTFGQPRLSWTPGKWEFPVVTYRVYRGTSPGAMDLVATLGNVSSWSDAGLMAGQTYYYQVRAVSNTGESPPSATISAVPTIPPDLAPYLIFIVIISLIGLLATIAFIAARKYMRRSKKRRMDMITTDKAAIEKIVADKVAAILPKKQSAQTYTDLGKEAVTEEDITLLKEKHYCIVHKGPVEGYSFICPGCGAYYCVKCVEAIKTIENRCWACKKPLDASMKTIDLEDASRANEEGKVESNKKGKIEDETGKKVGIPQGKLE